MPERNWDTFIERKIREAQEAGAFENLRGAGQKSEETPSGGQAPDLEMIHRLLKEQGFLPAWIELSQEITQELDQARQALARSYDWRRQALAAAHPDPIWIQGEWERSVRAFEARLERINKMIFDYNLQLPRALVNRQRFKVRLEDELRRIGAS